MLNENKLYEHEFKVRVRYSETDQMGVVYHGNYAQYFEMGAWNGLENWDFYKMDGRKWRNAPVVSLNINYKKPARYDDLLTVKTILKVNLPLR
jgi:acyl-CoA thioester hydrolase